MIYAVEILDSLYVKVGFCKAADAQQRIASLQTGSPFELKLVGLIEGTLMQEQALHKALLDAFARIRVPMPPNEWYPGKLPFMREFVETMPLGPNQLLAFCDKYSPTLNMGRRGSALLPNLKWGYIPSSFTKPRTKLVG